MALMRTGKSCGPDAPTLVSSFADFSAQRRWQESPVAGESTKETVKTIACGNAGCSGGLVVTTLVCVTTLCARGCGCSGHPAFPTPSVGRKIQAQLGRIAPRDRGLMFEIGKPSLRGAKRRSNPFFLYVARWIASRSLSSGAHSRDPVARNDVQCLGCLEI